MSAWESADSLRAQRAQLMERVRRSPNGDRLRAERTHLEWLGYDLVEVRGALGEVA